MKRHFLFKWTYIWDELTSKTLLYSSYRYSKWDYWISKWTYRRNYGTVIGDVVSNLGVKNGFDPVTYPTYEGNIYILDAITQNAQFCLLRLYVHLNDLPVNVPNPLYLQTDTTHDATFGTG